MRLEVQTHARASSSRPLVDNGGLARVPPRAGSDAESEQVADALFAGE